MTQRIFDVNNPQDVKDLFGILPNIVKKIYKDTPTDGLEFYGKVGEFIGSCTHIRVNWHDKVQITRPADKSQWIGKLCWFWDGDLKYKSLGVLKKTDMDYYAPYEEFGGACYRNCRPVRRDEIKFVEDVE